MRQLRKKSPLFEELLLQNLGLFIVAGERLERIVRAQLLVHDLVHVAHTALPEQTDDGVRTNLIAG